MERTLPSMLLSNGLSGTTRLLGIAPNRRRLGDETDLVIRVLGSGRTGYWVPEARVEHCIGHERQTVRYIADYSAGLGETHALQSASIIAATPFWFGVPRRLWPRLLKRGSLY